MNNASDELADYEAPPSSLEASDEVIDDSEALAHYCPTRLLDTFCLLMAGHGRSINTSMMLGDREYAMWQLARAHTIDDAPLAAVASRLFTYFDSGAPHAAALRA